MKLRVRNWTEILTGTVVVLLVLAIGLASYAVDRGVDSEEAKEIFAEYYDQTAKQKNRLCDEPANKDRVECRKDAPPVQKIEKITTVPVGPTQSQVDASVRRFLPILLGEEVSAYCAGGACDGSQGSKGKKGDPGEQGDPGAPGEPGAPGADGTDGKDAPTVTDVDCDTTVPGTYRFVFNFSDGSTKTAECGGP